MATSASLRPVLSIKKDSVYKIVFFSFLFIGYLNTVLRTDPDSSITLFRLLLPLMVFFSLLVFRSAMIKYGLMVLVFLVYGLFNSLLISRFDFNFTYFLHYSTIIFIIILTFSLIKKFGIQSVYRHLRGVYILMIVLAILQFFYQFEFPNTFYRYTLNIYYWVENDFTTALASFIPFLLVASDKKIANRILAIIGIAIIVYNSSRIAVLSIFFFIVFRLLDRLGWAGYAISAIAVILLFVIFQNYRLEGNTLYQLLADPFTHIFTLTPYTQYGSIYDRTNALIFGLKELIGSWGFGIGPGNATMMFEKPEYFLRTAQSMHNFIAQIMVEYGWLMLTSLLYFWVRTFNIRRKIGVRTKHDRLFYIYLVTVSLASLTQSEGLFSNYYFFVSFTASVYFFGNENVISSSTDERTA